MLAAVQNFPPARARLPEVLQKHKLKMPEKFCITRAVAVGVCRPLSGERSF